MSRPIYIVAAEYSAPPGAQRVESVFDRTRGAEPPPLLPLMENAARRALDALPSRARRQARIDHLLLTTMPIRGAGAGSDLRLPDDAMNLTGLLQRSLKLPDHCVTRFELGSSDGGAALFASGVRLLQGVAEPTTALLVAGQVMPRGAAAIETVGQVIEVSERQLGLRMIPVGDLLLDAFWARLCERSGGPPGPGQGPQDPSELAGRLAASKLRLASEYPAAMRRDPDAAALSGRPLARWLHDAHVAHACNGACAVVLTTDEAVVEGLITGGHRRLVRVLGVGEGNDDPVLTRRPEPLMFFKAMRQSLVFLRRSAGAHVDFLRGSAFAIFHDAFPSIELGFLTALGFDAADAIDRAGSYWSNPYGGLTAFGHAMAASGMVQIAKAWHVLTRPEAYLPPRVDAPSRHPDHTRSAIPIHCLTTSVGGPMTHVVASLLQSVPVEGGIPPPFALDRTYSLPPDARRPDPNRSEPWTFEGKTDWAAARGTWFRDRCAELAESLGLDGVGVIVGRTRLDLRSVALPLADGFLDRWRLPAFVDAEGQPRELPRGRQALLIGALSTSRQAVETAIEAVVTWLAGDPADQAQRRALRRRIYATLRPPVALVDGGGDGFATPHGLCLLPDEAVPVGALVAVHAGPPGGLACVGADLTARHRAVIPPWYGAPAGDDRTPLLTLPRAEAESVANLIRVLRAAPLTAESWAPIFRTTERLLTALAASGRPATEWLRRLLQTLMYAPDPDRWTIAEALEILCGVQAAPPPADELTGYVEFDLWRAGDRPPVELARLFDTVEEAISRARGWLGGSDLHLSRLGDTYAAIARRRPPAMSTRLGAELWPQVLRFARDVYDACLRRDVPLRVVVDVSTEGMPIVRRGAYLGVAGAGPVEARLVMTGAPHFMRRPRGAAPDGATDAADQVGAGHGIALVRSGAALALSDAELAHWADARWSEVGGLDGFVVDRARLDGRAFYHICWRPSGRPRHPTLRGATPFDARDDVVGVICYSAADRPAARALGRALREAGRPMWADEPLESGGFWQRQIDARQPEARIALLLVGEESHGWRDTAVRQRIARMVAAGVRLLPVILPGADADAWPLMQGGLWKGAPIRLADPADAAPLAAPLDALLGLRALPGGMDPEPNQAE